MELWFAQNEDKEEQVKKIFKKELVDLNRLIEYQDINEVLILTEFMMVIVVKGQNSQELLERIGQLSEATLEDLKDLIEGTLAPITEYDMESNYLASSFANNMQFKQEVFNQLEITEKKSKRLEL